MLPQTVILAYLANRYPAAYTVGTITQRVNMSGLLDKRITEADTEDALRILVRVGSYVESDVEKLTGKIYWNATTEGVKFWQITGSLYVEA